MPVVGIWQSGGARLREGVAVAGRRRPRLRRADPRQRPGAADPRRARPGRRRRGVRPGADRRHRHGPAGPGVRHRPRRHPPGHRRGRHRRAARRPRDAHAGPAASRTSRRPPTTRRSTPRAAWSSPARRAGHRRPARRRTGPTPARSCPASTAASYDVRPVVRAVLDAGSFVELQPRLGPQRRHRARPARRAHRRGRRQRPAGPRRLPRRRHRRQDRPLRAVVRRARRPAGVPRRRARLPAGRRPGGRRAWCAAARSCCTRTPPPSCPRLTVVLRKSFGGAFIAMGSKGLGADHVYAWPGAQVDVMGATAAVEVLHRRELAAERDPEPAPRWSTALAAHHEATTGGLTRALECGAVDAVVEPAETRRVLLRRARRPAGRAAARGTRTGRCDLRRDRGACRRGGWATSRTPSLGTGRPGHGVRARPRRLDRRDPAAGQPGAGHPGAARASAATATAARCPAAGTTTCWPTTCWPSPTTAGATRAVGLSLGAGALLRLLRETPTGSTGWRFVLPAALDVARADGATVRLRPARRRDRRRRRRRGDARSCWPRCRRQVRDAAACTPSSAAARSSWPPAPRRARCATTGRCATSARCCA